MHSKARKRHRNVLDRLQHQFKRKIMNNVLRGAYVECLIAEQCGPDWMLTWELEHDWAAWDLEHTPTGMRIEIKNSARRQSWHTGTESPPAPPRFTVKWPKEYWNGTHYVQVPEGTQPTDVYIFAWHAEGRQGVADQRNPDQWQYYVVPTSLLPPMQKSIGLKWLNTVTDPVSGDQLREVLLSMANSLARNT